MDSSACETETDDKRGNRLNPNKVKTIRSKSSSPNRQVIANFNLDKTKLNFYSNSMT